MRVSLDSVYLRMLQVFAERSTCRRRNVAAIFVDGDGKVLSVGYNGVPRGLPHCIDMPCPGAEDEHGDNKRCWAVHAEQNAILQCPDISKVETIYCSCTPCFECAKMIVNMKNVRRIYVGEVYADKEGLSILYHAGIAVHVRDLATGS